MKFNFLPYAIFTLFTPPATSHIHTLRPTRPIKKMASNKRAKHTKNTIHKDISDIKCVSYQDSFLPPEIYKNALENLLHEIEFCSKEESAITIFGKRTYIPRSHAGYGNPGTSYKFSGVRVAAKDWATSPTLFAIKEHVVKTLHIPVSYVLVNLYRTGSDYIGYHSDDEKGLNPNYPIISVSLGAARPFRFQHKESDNIHETILKDNSVIIMSPPCQREYKHCLPQRKNINNIRLNLTFRVMQ